MTTQERDVFAAKFKQMWDAKEECDCFEWGAPDRIAFRLCIGADTYVRATVFDNGTDVVTEFELFQWTRGASLRANQGTIYSHIAQSKMLGYHQAEFWLQQEKDLVARWMPTFRRNCILLGFPAEYSAHEKLEWTLWPEEEPSVP